jgi:predicted nucleotidyltransferase
MISIKEEVREIIRKCNPQQEWVINNCIFLHIAGSKMYGTATSKSDTDIRGITIPSKDHWVGAKHFEQFEYVDDNIDICIYDIRKYLNTIQRVSPNTVESLFAPADVIIVRTNIWFDLLPRIKKLINQTAYMGYLGYSSSQLKKMIIKHGNKTGRQDLVNEFGFDVKFASHALRLARQGAELLTTGNITFPRPDREELLTIRQGKKYGQHETDKCIADLETEISNLKKAHENTILPPKVDFQAMNQLLMDVYDKYVHNGDQIA